MDFSLQTHFEFLCKSRLDHSDYKSKFKTYRLDNYKLIVGNVDCPDGGCKPKQKDDTETELDIFERQSGLPQNNSRLFDLTEDEKEEYDLSEVYPEIVADLQLRLK